LRAVARTAPVREVAAGVDDEAVQPRGELRGAAELSDPDTQLRQRLLSCIARILGVAQDVRSELFNPRCMPLAERFERAPVAVLRPFHQDRIAQPRVDERPLRPEGSLDWTGATDGEFHGGK